MNKIILLFFLIISLNIFLLFHCTCNITSPVSLPSPCDGDEQTYKIQKINFSFNDTLQISIFGLALLTLLWLLFIYLCYHVRYVTFNTDLSICGQNRRFLFPPCILIISFMFLFWFLLTEYFFDLTLWSFSYINFDYVNPVKLSRRSRKAVVRISLWTCLIYIFFTATTYVACIFCLLVFQIFCHFSMRTTQCWLPIILIILSNDIHLNPGPEYNNNFFNFMSWNLNSLAKDNFQRVSLIEAHNYF